MANPNKGNFILIILSIILSTQTTPKKQLQLHTHFLLEVANRFWEFFTSKNTIKNLLYIKRKRSK